MSESLEKIVGGTDDLYELAIQLRDFASDCKIWAFFGELGAGKTTFIKHICKSMGINENVSSPTFSLVNEYRDNQGNQVFHFDFYRIESEKEAVDIGCEEYFDSGSLCLIEWPEKILNLLPHPHVKVEIKVLDTKRKFIFSHE